MPNFRYQALTDGGSSISGVIEANTIDEARLLIASKGYIPSKVTKEGAGGKEGGLSGYANRMGSVKVSDIILFTKQFKTMFNAGLSIINLLEVLEQQTENPKLKVILLQISEDIKQGSSLYNSFIKHQAVFSPLYCAMLRAGEISGTLPEVLERLIYLIEHDYKIKKQIKSALIYPIIVLVTLVLAFIFLLWFVIPKFAAVFKSAKIELPLPTRICIGMYEVLFAWWHVMLGSVVGFVVVFMLYIRTKQGNLAKDRVLLRLPIIGPVFLKGAMARFASIFSLLQSSGVSILDTVGILSDTIGNSAISEEFDNLKEKLQEGRGISGPLRMSRNFTPMIINMIAIGEETGELDAMMREVAKHYDFEVEYAVQKMTEMIGPVLMGVLALMVGFFAMAIFFPIFDLTKTAG